MKLTLSNIVLFFRDYFNVCVQPNTEIRNISNELIIDGEEIFYLFKALEKEFNVSFINFDFKKYFLEEKELNTGGWIWCKQPRQRKIEHELTIGELYEYMKNNKKQE